MNAEKSRLHNQTENNISDRRSRGISSLALPNHMLAVLSLTTVACTLPLPLLLKDSAHTAAVAWIVCLLCGLTVLMTVKKLSVMVITLVFGFSLISYSGSPVIAALILGSVICIGTGSAIVYSGRGLQRILLLILPVLSFGIAFAITKDPIYSLVALVYYPPMLALGISSSFKTGKTTSIISASAFIIATAFGFFLLLLKARYGSVSLEAVSLAGADLGASYVHLTESALLMAGMESISASLHRQLQAEAQLLVNSSFGLLVSICLVAVYLAHNLHCRILESAGLSELVTKDMTTLTASVASALIYIVAHVLTYTTNASGGTSVAAVVGANLCYILMPLLALKGYEALKVLIEKFYLLGLIASAAIAIAIFALSSFTSSSVLILLALTGAFYVIIAEVEQWAKDHFEKGESNE